MTGRRPRILVAHADGEEALAARLAEPLQEAGYDVVHGGTVLVGESLTEEASRVLAEGGPVVLCGTVRAMGTGWAHRLCHAARAHQGCLILPVRMEPGAYLEPLTWDAAVAEHWRDPARAVAELRESLARHFPGERPATARASAADVEERYRGLLLDNYDLMDLSGLPQREQRATATRLELRRLYVPLRVTVESPLGADVERARMTAILHDRERDRGVWSIERRPAPPDERVRASIGERLGAARRLMVLGDPGAGKSTLLKWIATSYLLRLRRDPDWRDLPDVGTLPDADLLPVVVRCRELEHDQVTRPFDEVLRHCLHKLTLSREDAGRALDLLLDRLRSGLALLLIDGLDEINDPRARSAFCDQVERTHVAHPEAMIVVTSRIVGYREIGRRIGRGFEHVRVAELTRQDKDEFARRWCEVVEPPAEAEDAARGLIEDVHSAPQIERLTGNPLLLTTMALVRRGLGHLPNRRGELYEEAVNVLLNWRPDVGERLTRSEARDQLGYVAYAMCQRQTQRLRIDELVDLCARMRAEFPNVHAARRHEPEDFVRLVEARTGLLSEVGRERHRGQLVGIYEFRHLGFQEYLAGAAIVSGCFPGHVAGRGIGAAVAALAAPVRSGAEGDERGRMAILESWREPIRQCVAACNPGDVDEVLRVVLEPAGGEEAAVTARPRAVLAALCLADEPDATREMARRIVRALADAADDREDRLSAPTDLGDAAGALARSHWRDLVDDTLIERYAELPSPARRPVGALYGRVAARLGHADEVARAAEWLDGDDPLLAARAALRVGAVADEDAFVDACRAAGIARRLIGRAGGLTPDADAAAWALARFYPRYGSDEWSPVWMTSGCGLSDDELDAVDRLLGGGAVRSEGALASLFELAGHLELRAAVPRAREALGHPEATVRAAAVLLLGALSDPAAMESLGRAVTGDPHPDVRAAAVRALDWGEDTRFAPVLAAALEDPDAGVRAAAAHALAWMQDAASAPAAFTAAFERPLRDPSPGVRRQAVWAVGSRWDRFAVEVLTALAGDADPVVRGEAIDGMEYAADGAARPRLVERALLALADDDHLVRRAAARALRHVDGPDRDARLIARLHDDDRQVRAEAMASLAWRGAAVSEEELDRLLRAGDQRPTGFAIDAMVAAGRDDVRGRVLAACEERPSLGLFMAIAGLHVNRHAPDAVVVWPDAVLDVLERHRAGADRDLRSGAVIALAAVGREDAIEELVRLAGSDRRWIELALADCARRLTTTRADLWERLASHDSGWVRYWVAIRLGELRSPDGIPVLRTLLADRSANVRRHAADALSHFPGSDEVARALIGALDDPSPQVRHAVVRGLARHRQDGVADALAAHLQDPVTWVRAAIPPAIEGERFDFPARPELVASLGDPMPSVRRDALWHLTRGRDAIDRQLVTFDIEGSSHRARDPRWPILPSQVRLAAWRLGREVDDVRRRFEAMARELSLPMGRMP